MEAREIKKVTKNFFDTSQEEKWLQRMLTDGWVLQSYDAEDVGDCRYIFKAITNDSQKDLLYKVDFRSFDKNEEFEEYKGIFEDAGWTLLSPNKKYSKHILYTDPSNAQTDIFSDKESFLEREKRRMSSSLTYVCISFAFLVVSIILYSMFDITAILGAGLIVFGLNIKYIIDFFKHRRVYRTLLKSEFE